MIVSFLLSSSPPPSVLMTVLFGSSATADARAPSHVTDGAEDSMERLMDHSTDNVSNDVTGKMVRFFTFL